MKIFSIEFMLMWIIGLAVFYTFGKKHQVFVLSVASLMVYIASIRQFPVVLVVCVGVTYWASRIIKQKGNSYIKILAIVICLVLLILGRTSNWITTLGNSYFILKAIGYLIDLERGGYYESNIVKYLLYLVYWPTIYEGPFNRIGDFCEQLKEEITFKYENLIHGMRRFVWGAFKNFVVSARLAIFVDYITSSLSGKGTITIIAMILAYAIKLYVEFSGFIDMMLGMSETFGITLPENFKQPYFSTSISEFWRRWHITLGAWFRDYVMFPLVSCRIIKRNAKKIRKRNKTIGKLFPLLIATTVVWILTGLWHGLSINYFIWGMYYALIMDLEITYDHVFFRPKVSYGIGKKMICICRTLMLVLVADTFICVNSISQVRVLWQEIIFNHSGSLINEVRMTSLGKSDLVILTIGLIIIFIVSLSKEYGINIQHLIDKSPILIRWGIYYGFIFGVFLFGLYGTQGDVSQFTYMQF